MLTPEFLEVFVPRDGHLDFIDPRSGIVGLYNVDLDDYQLYFESNRFGADNIKTFADRCLHAADRLVQRYPTIAQTRAFASQVTFVGQWRPAERRVVVINEMRRNLLAHWLGADTLDERELVATS